MSPGILIFNFCLSNIKLYFKREESLHSLYLFYKYMGFLQHRTSLFIFSEFNIVCLDAFYLHHYFLLEQVLLKPDLTQHSTTIWEREPKFRKTAEIFGPNIRQTNRWIDHISNSCWTSRQRLVLLRPSIQSISTRGEFLSQEQALKLIEDPWSHSLEISMMRG